MQKRALVGMILVLVALIMMGASLAFSWYKVEIKMRGNGFSSSGYIEYYLDHASLKAGEESVEAEYNATVEDEPSVKTFRTTQILVIIGIICCILGLIGAALVTWEKIGSKGGAVLVVIAVILCLIAPLYLMFTLPGAFKEEAEQPDIELAVEEIGTDFFGSKRIDDMNWTTEYYWGGSTGWFLTIFASIICIIALILVAISKPTPVPTTQQMPMPLDMYAQPYDIVPPPQAQFYADEEAFPQYPSPLQIPRPQGEDFQCPNCSSIFILTLTKRPAIIRCPYCGLEGLVE